MDCPALVFVYLQFCVTGMWPRLASVFVIVLSRAASPRVYIFSCCFSFCFILYVSSPVCSSVRFLPASHVSTSCQTIFSSFVLASPCFIYLPRRSSHQSLQFVTSYACTCLKFLCVISFCTPFFLGGSRYVAFSNISSPANSVFSSRILAHCFIPLPLLVT